MLKPINHKTMNEKKNIEFFLSFFEIELVYVVELPSLELMA